MDQTSNQKPIVEVAILAAQGQSQAEIAASLGLSQATVSRRLKQARQEGYLSLPSPTLNTDAIPEGLLDGVELDLASRYDWKSFEKEVAELYRSLGAMVRQNVSLGGLQIDIFVEEETASRQRLRLAVECKFYHERVGNRVANDFARVAATLKASDLADRGVIVSEKGFTKDASLVSETTGIELITIDDLRQSVKTLGNDSAASPQHVSAATARSDKPRAVAEQESSRLSPRVFVVMPFSTELDDLYYLGIRKAVQEIGGSCERADELQYTGGVVEKIYASVRLADILIAEVSDPNPNVYYEVGFAHALEKPVILLTQDVKKTPFDLRGQNHVIYESIVELRKILPPLLSGILED